MYTKSLSNTEYEDWQEILMVKNSLRREAAKFQVLAPPPTCCVISGKMFSLSEPYFPHHKTDCYCKD